MKSLILILLFFVVQALSYAGRYVFEIVAHWQQGDCHYWEVNVAWKESVFSTPIPFTTFISSSCNTMLNTEVEAEEWFDESTDWGVDIEGTSNPPDLQPIYEVIDGLIDPINETLVLNLSENSIINYFTIKRSDLNGHIYAKYADLKGKITQSISFLPSGTYLLHLFDVTNRKAYSVTFNKSW